jgi:protein-S-isoprenylcysteine O-methyltransferase Ste14
MQTTRENKVIKWVKRGLKILLIFVLSVLFSAFFTQFIPPIIVGRMQVEFFILVIACFALFSFCFKKNKNNK